MKNDKFLASNREKDAIDVMVEKDINTWLTKEADVNAEVIKLKTEYSQTKYRYDKLKEYCNKIEMYEKYRIGHKINNKTPLELLREQQKYMGLYLSTLEKRAIIENIKLV